MWATKAGSLFKCPLCNDNEKCCELLPKYGIFIPVRDADWELEENYFEEFLEPPQRSCELPSCTLSLDMSYSDDPSLWKICSTCGAGSIHLVCFEATSEEEFQCQACKISMTLIREHENEQDEVINDHSLELGEDLADEANVSSVVDEPLTDSDDNKENSQVMSPWRDIEGSTSNTADISESSAHEEDKNQEKSSKRSSLFDWEELVSSSEDEDNLHTKSATNLPKSKTPNYKKIKINAKKEPDVGMFDGEEPVLRSDEQFPVQKRKRICFGSREGNFQSNSNIM